MKKFLALLLAAIMLCATAAIAEEAAAPIQIGQVQYAAHGTGCFAVITAVVQGDTILAAKIDEYQFLADRADVAAIGVPNTTESFGENFPEGKVLGSKRVNSDLYSLNMQRAGSTTAIAASYDAIEAYVAGKTIAELEAETAEAEATVYVDAISGSTLADSLNYVKGIIAAAKAAGEQKGTYTLYNKTGETVTEIYLIENESGEQSVNYAANGFADGKMMVITTVESADANAHGFYKFTFKTEGGYEASFDTLSIEVAPITLLAEDAKTGATAISFFAPAE